MKREDRTSWLNPRLSTTSSSSAAGGTSRGSSLLKAGGSSVNTAPKKKAGPREVGRVNSDEWTPAVYEDILKEMHSEDRTSWLQPRLSVQQKQKKTTTKITKKAGPREIGRVGSDEWKPAFYPEVLEDLNGDRSSWLKPRLSVKSSGSAASVRPRYSTSTASVSSYRPRLSNVSNASSVRSVASVTVLKKAGPREIGRVGSDEWTPAVYPEVEEVTDRTSWLKPRLSVKKAGHARSKSAGRRSVRKAGPRDIG